MNKQQLAAKIWESANQMRSKIEANEYKDYILGFIFYKYLSDKQLQFARKEDFTEEDIKVLTEEDEETVNHFKKNIGYFIAYDDLFSTWIEKKQDFDVANVRDALSAFGRLISPAHKKLFEGIFDTLQTGLSKLGDSAAKQTKAISDLLHLIKNIPMDGKQDYDVLGFIYEYLIEKFAANAGKKAGEFYTPHEVSYLMSEIVADHLKDRKEIQIYDSCSGSGSLLINIGNSVAKHMDDKNNIKYFAQELKKNTYNLTRMNLVMRDILPNNIATRNGDTLEDDWPYFDENDPVHTYNTLYVDAVVSNPPYSQKWDPANKDSDPRYSRFGLAPMAKADFAFLLHDLFHIKPDGIMTIVLPKGILFRGGDESIIREKLIEANHIDTIIGLPPNIFFGTPIATTIIVLKQKRKKTDILFVDASKKFIKIGKNNKLQASDIKRIVDSVINRENNLKFSKVISRDEIRRNAYNLNIPRYVDSSDNSESWDIYSTMFGGIPVKEIDELGEYWQEFPGLREDIFSKTSDSYSKLKVKDVNTTISEHSITKEFINRFNTNFKDLESFLKKELIINMNSVNITKEEELICDDVFERLKKFPLIDKYEAYQKIYEDWTNVAIDLEIIQAEGFEATKKVDPNMVNKKKNGKEQEVQEGWIGRIMPFELVQTKYLKNELKSLKQKENRLIEINSNYKEILDSFSEEEKELDAVNEGMDGFVNTIIIKESKLYKVENNNNIFLKDSYEAKILKVDALLTEEKELKKLVKIEAANLHQQTKDTIENLSDNQALELIEDKWVKPIIKSVYKLPDMLINQLVTKTQHLSKKYNITYTQITEEIHETENELTLLFDELEGNEFDMKGLSQFKKLLKGK